MGNKVPMNTRASSPAIQRRIMYLQGLGIDITADKMLTGWRFETNKGSKPLSPRLRTKAEAINWLEAFETGYELGKEAAVQRPLHTPECDCVVCDMERKRRYREAKEG